MNKIMVCVTGQKTCQRLIDYGKRLKSGSDDQMYIIHVTTKDHNFLDKTVEGEALEYLFEEARNVGADLTVKKSDDVLNTLVDLALDNHIDKVVVGESKEATGPNNFLERLRKAIGNRAQIIEVPAIS